MRNRLLSLFSVVVLIFSFSACKNRKSKSLSDEQLVELPSGVKQKLSKKEFDFGSLSLKAKVNYTEGTTSQSFTMNIRMIRDTAIWTSISAFGIEVARALMTPDSLKLINRIENTYFLADIDELKRFTQRSYSLKQLQNLMVGNSVYPLDDYQKKNNELYADYLSLMVDQSEALFTVNQSLRPKQSILKEELQQRSVVAEYSNYKKINRNGLIPTKIDLTAKSGQRKFKADIEYATVNTSDITVLPFKIPSKYEEVH